MPNLLPSGELQLENIVTIGKRNVAAFAFAMRTQLIAARQPCRWLDLASDHWCDLLVRSLSVVFEYAESEIERLFLSHVVLLMARRDPGGLVIVPPIENLLQVIGNQKQIHDVREAVTGVLLRPSLFERRIEKGTALAVLENAPGVRLYSDFPDFDYSIRLTMQPNLALPDLATGRARLDAFAWCPGRDDLLLAIECDGYKWHSGHGQFELDRQRDRALASRGICTLRYSGREIMRCAEKCASDLVRRLRLKRAAWLDRAA